MKLSIIIVSWNVSGLLDHCLASIKQFEPSFAYDVWVIDNASADDSCAMVKQKYPWVHLIANTDNKGFAAANNQGIAQSQGEYVLLLNPDTQVYADTLQKSVTYLEHRKDVGILGCQLRNADGSIQPSVRAFPTVWSQVGILLKLHHLFPNLGTFKRYFAYGFDYTQEQEVDQVMGAYFLMPRWVMEKYGSLDNAFFIWFEEVDLCKRIKDVGLKVLFFPSVRITHHWSQSFKQVLSVKKQQMFNESLLLYFSKHHSRLETIFLWMCTKIALGIALLYQLIKKKG